MCCRQVAIAKMVQFLEHVGRPSVMQCEMYSREGWLYCTE